MFQFQLAFNIVHCTVTRQPYTLQSDPRYFYRRLKPLRSYCNITDYSLCA